MAQAFYVPTNRGVPQIYCGGRLYQKLMPDTDGSISWSCHSNRDLEVKCRSRCKTLGELIIAFPDQHEQSCHIISEAECASAMILKQNQKTRHNPSNNCLKRQLLLT